MSTTESHLLTGVTVCAPGGAGESLGQEEAEKLASRLKAIADPARLRLISMIIANGNDEACVCDLIDPMNLSQGTVSHHLKILREAGILAREKRGTWAYYSLVPGALTAIAASLVAV